MTTIHDFDDGMLMKLIQASLAAHHEPDAAVPTAVPAASSPPLAPAVPAGHVHWSVHQVQSMAEFYQVISTLTELTDDSGTAPAHGMHKVVIISSDFRVNLALNAFIRFYAQLDGMLFSARSVVEAYTIIYNVSQRFADEY